MTKAMGSLRNTFKCNTLDSNNLFKCDSQGSYTFFTRFRHIKKHLFRIPTLSIFVVLLLSPVAFGQNNYRFEIIARTGMTIGDAGKIIDLGPGPSINDDGRVAFVAQTENENGKQRHVVISDWGKMARIVTAAPTERLGTDVQLNNSDSVVWWYTIEAPGSARNGDTEIIRFDLPVDEEDPVIGRGSNFFTTDFQYVLPWASLNNNGGVVFSGDLKSGGTVLAYEDDQYGPGPDAMSSKISNFPIYFPMIADNNRIIFRSGNNANSPVIVFLDETFTEPTALWIATSADFNTIGKKPGISDDGKVVVIVGDEKQEGPGVYIFIIGNTNSPIRVKVADIENFNLSLQFRTGVNRSNDFTSNNYTVTYLKTNSESKPVLCSKTINITNSVAANDTEALNLVEVGKKISAYRVGYPLEKPLLLGEVEDIGVYDPINNKGEIIFWVRTNRGQTILRALPDADEDGLIDRWETTGIKDNKGEVILNLQAMGADPIVKDVFIEIDYMGATIDKHGHSHSHKPRKVAIDAVTSAFLNAPVDPDLDAQPGFRGIRLHIDYGKETVMNPVSGERWDSKSESDELEHSINSGQYKSYDNYVKCNGIEASQYTFKLSAFSLENLAAKGLSESIIKLLEKIVNQEFIGIHEFESALIQTIGEQNWTDNKNNEKLFQEMIRSPKNLSFARRSAFHYVLFVHNRCDGTSGGFTWQYTGDSLISLGRAPTCETRPISLPPGCNQEGDALMQAGTFMHEIGHSLGLQHGGADNLNYKPNYLSVMNYFFQLRGISINTDHPAFQGQQPVLIDYSRFDEKRSPSVDEEFLYEINGLNDGNESLSGYTTFFYCQDGNYQFVENVNDPIDWNCNGEYDYEVVSANINSGVLDLLVPLGIKVPDVTKQKLSIAEEAINDRLFVLGEIKYKQEDEVSSGFVISQEPSAFMEGFTGRVPRVLKVGSKIDLVVSSGPAVAPEDDFDDDGYNDGVDNCPKWRNPNQDDNDVNKDKEPDPDGVGDACDNCPRDFQFHSEFSDIDGDGIGDICDNCPEVFNPFQRDDNGDGIGNACELTVLRSYNDWELLKFKRGAIGGQGFGGDLFLDPPPEELIQEEASLLVKPYAIEVIHSEGVSIPRGGEGNYNFRVKNIGEKLDTYILSATSSLGWSKPDLMPEKVVLVPGEELIVPIKVTVPANALEGKRDKFTLKAVSLTVSLIEDWASTATVVSESINFVIVPSIIGLSRNTAESILVGANLIIGSVTTENSASLPEGTVISQNPSAASEVPEGSEVDLVVSSGPEQILVPDLVGETQSDAEVAIITAGLEVGTVNFEKSSAVPSGAVISQNPLPGTMVDHSTIVVLVVSIGPALKPVPNVVGLSQIEAESALISAGLVVGNVDNAGSSTIPAGNVIDQNPSAGTDTAYGSPVDLVVSSGPPKAIVPNVGDLTQTAAEIAITDAGLAVGDIKFENSQTVPEGLIISQVPEGGQSVDAGSAVNLTVSLGPEAKLISIAVTPTRPSATPGTTMQFTATGTYSDGSTGDITTSVNWTSSVPGIATVSNEPGSEGLVTILSAGTSTITAIDAATGILGSSTLLDTAGYFLELRNIRLNGSGTAIHIEPGSSISLAADYTIWSRSGCPSCIDWIAVGIEQDGQDGFHVGIPGRYPGRSGGANFSLTAPDAIGTYRVYAKLAPVYTEQDAINSYESAFPDQGNFIPIGTINVVINSAPELTPIDNQELNEGGTLSVSITAFDSDGDELILSVSDLPAFGAVTDNGDGTGSIGFNPAYGDAGTYPMTVTAGDGQYSASESFTLTVYEDDIPKDCREILINGAGVGDGTYVIDPDGPGGQDPINVECLMSLSDGGWTKLTEIVSQTEINTGSTVEREYLYEKDGKWYRTPTSNLVWDWNSPKVLTGTYHYTGGSFYCGSSDEVTRYYGVGCSNGGGNQWKALIYNLTGKDPANAQVQLCQDRPGIFEFACQTGVTVYIRSEDQVQGIVPDVLGLSEIEAEAAIVNAGLVVGTKSPDLGPNDQYGDVIGQDPPADTEVPGGSAVGLVFSVFIIESPMVPNIVGLDQAAAEEKILGQDLIVGTITEQYSNTIPAGIIMSQNPPDGERVSVGTAVDFVISLGPETVTVPNVVGLSGSSAQATLTAAGLVVGNIGPAIGDDEQYYKVVGQTPAAGSQMPDDSQVDLFFSVLLIETIISFQEDFESGGEGWIIDNGVWEIGTPTAGPSSCYSGEQCAGTVFDGDYARYADSRLISPTVQLPGVSGEEELHLRFQQWFSYHYYDAGYVQISVWDSVNSEWSAWQSADTGTGDTGTFNSSPWSLKNVDLTLYAGETVRIGFYHTASSNCSSCANERPGWYIDDIEFIVKAPSFTGDFESGLGDWGTDRGIWQVGTPTAGPGSCYSGEQCAGTVLDGDYARYADSRLISPTVQLPGVSGEEELHLRFQQWFSYHYYDAGYVQISVWDSVNSEWSAWQSVDTGTGDTGTFNSSPWSLKDVDLTLYAGETVRIGFYHTASSNCSSCANERPGWYIDDIEFIVKAPSFIGDFESGLGDWGTDRGIWQVGTPTAGPESCYSGEQCAGTVFDGDYARYADSRLISPTVQLPGVSGEEELHLRFQQWFSYHYYDAGYVQISVWDSVNSEWSAWQSADTGTGDTGTFNSSPWSLKNVDLTLYAGETVRIGFYHTASSNCSSCANERPGWYIDDIEFIVKAPSFTGDFESGLGDWGTDRGIWQVGTPTAGPESCYSGEQCAGTVLDGDYARYADSRLISPTVQLPGVSGEEELHLRFQQWFSYHYYDAGYVQISVWDSVNSEWSAWQSVDTGTGDTGTFNSSPWSLKDVDLTLYAGETVRIGFYHTASSNCSSCANERPGWYIDDIEFIVKAPSFIGDFESGLGDWGTDRGIWQVGTPTAGPESCYSGEQCAGTVFDGDYARYADSRLISPTVQLPGVSGEEELHLRFQQWFSYHYYDAGYVQISVWDSVNSEWSAWQSADTGTGDTGTFNSSPWSLKDVDLTLYAGETVRIGFYHTASSNCSSCANESTGWYIDDIDVGIINYTPRLTPINDQEVDENESLSISIFTTDLDGDSITLSVSGLPGFGSFTNNGVGTGTMVFNPGYGDAGQYPISIVADDGVLSSTEEFTLTVNNVNRPPVLGDVGSQTLYEGGNLPLTLTATDPDGDTLSFDAVDLPPFAGLTDNGDGTANLLLTPGSGDAGGYDVTVSVTDTGTPALSDSETFAIQVHVIAMEVSPGSIDFGEVSIGASDYQTFTIANTGTAALQVDGIQSSDGAFSIFPPNSFTIEPGDPVRTVSVGFSPTAAGEFSGVISVLSNTGDPATITATGRGVAAVEPADIQTRDSLEFGSVVEATSKSLLLTITNDGGGVLTVSEITVDNPVFILSAVAGDIYGFPFIINPGESRNLSVHFTPPNGSAGTSYSEALTITSDDPDEGTKSVALSGHAIDQTLPGENSPIFGARVYFDPDVFDVINAATCADVGGWVQLGADAVGSDNFQVTLTDQRGQTVSSASLSAIDGPGMAAFNGVNACGLADGIVDIEAIYKKDGAELRTFSGTPAVKYTGTLEPPLLEPVPPFSFSPTIQVCGTSRANTTVRIEGGARIVSTTLDGSTTEFCLDVPLRPNTQNTLIASAIDDLAPPPKPVAYARPVQVVQLDLSEIVIVDVYSRPLTQAEIEDLVDRGIIDLADPSNFNVSMFTVVFTIGAFPIPITITQPVVVSPIPGSVSYGLGGGWFSGGGGGGGGGSPGGVIENAAQIVVIRDERGQTIPGVIIIDGRIKTLKEFFQITIALWNVSDSFNLSGMTAGVRLPAGLTPIAAGPGSDIPDVNLEGTVDTLLIGEIGPGETGIGQFIIRGDAIGIYDVNVEFEGFVTGGGLPEPVPVSGSAGTTVQVLGPPELDVLLRFLTNPDGPDVTAGDVFDLIVEITNVSDRPALYTSLELFVGDDAELVGIDGNPVSESNEIRSFGHIQPGQTVTAAFRLRSLTEGEIIACQAITAENITLSIDIGPDGVPCNIVNMYPPNFEPLPADAAPVVIGVNPANGQTNIPITTSVFAVLTPRSDCIVADTWTNVVVDFIDPLDHSKGLQVISADLVKSGTFYLEELNASGRPVRHIPVDLTVVDPPAGGTTIAVLRLGLDSPHPNSQYFLSSHTTYRATLVGGSGGVCSAASGARMENSYIWSFTTGGVTNSFYGACCLPDDSCTIGTQVYCGSIGGFYIGDGTDCSSGPCSYDSDGDGVPDIRDLCSDTPIGADVDANGCADSQKDSDGDGISDDQDICPGTPIGAPVDVNGCSAAQRDSDGDGVFDDLDLCPDTPVNAVVDDNGCSADQRDADGDGVTDDLDLCPDTPIGAAVDVNGCSAAQRDSDGDGVFDDLDLCPGTPAGTAVNADGCPIGGCTLPDGSCVWTTEQECLNASDTPGEYLGDGSQCTATGACILPDGCCTQANEQACTNLGGTYEGNATQCSQYLVDVPDVSGIPEAEAQDLLTALCLAVETECIVPETPVPAGEVISQDPPEGNLAAQGDVVLLGVSAGLSAMPITVEGSSSGIFVFPQGPSGMVTGGIDTSSFTWGTPLPASAASGLNFAANSFDAVTEEEFTLGTLTFFNGTVEPQSDADTVDLEVAINFSTPDGIVQRFVYNLELIDTPNISGTSPEKQADIVKLSSLYSRSVFIANGIAYTLKLTFGNIVSDEGGFTERRQFFVYEGQGASAELRAKITACNDLSPMGACLLSDGSCTQATEQDCINVIDGIGEYLGDGTQCPPTGACILPDGCCTQGTEQECSDVSGLYQGDDIECEEYLVEMPDVIGMTEADAQADIEALCLKAETECVVVEMSPPAGEVVSQEPAGGDLVALNDVVVLGISSGVSITPRPVEGSGAGIFANPTGPAEMVTTGVDTNYFTWGSPGAFGTGPSSLTFEGKTFATATEEEFLLGNLTFYNGTIEMFTDANTIDFTVNMDLSSHGGITQRFVYTLELIDTPGTRNTPPEIQADIVNLPGLLPRSIFAIDGVAYTLELTIGNIIGNSSGFGERNRFFVYEGESASAELHGKITACVEPLAKIDDLYARAKSGKIDIVWTPQEGAHSYRIFRSTTQGGPYELIADGHVTDYCVYADFGLTDGVTYYYVVRWVDVYGQESPDSNEAGATPTERRRRP